MTFIRHGHGLHYPLNPLCHYQLRVPWLAAGSKSSFRVQTINKEGIVRKLFEPQLSYPAVQDHVRTAMHTLQPYYDLHSRYLRTGSIVSQI
jgi:hypothetical protein